MKKIIMLFIVVCLTTTNTQAQLFNKLKEKAAKALEKKPEQKMNNNNNDAEKSPVEVSEKANKKATAPGSNCSVIFTLGEDESLLYDETQVKVIENKTSYTFIVSNKKYQYFLIEDGKRSGPFTYNKIPVPSNKNSESDDDANNKDENINMGGDNKDPISAQYCKTINGKLYIVFSGKNYGPYDYVSKMILSSDKKKFFALVTIGGESPMTIKMGMGNNYMVNEGTLKQQVSKSGTTMAMKLSVSKSFKQCMATVLDQINQKIISATSTNKQAGAEMADLYSGSSNTSFVSDDGDIITIPAQSPTQILVNGKEAASFKVPIKNMERLFIMPDVSKSVYYENKKIYKADGTEQELKDVLFPKIVAVGNAITLFYYRMYKNDNGAKEVFLCKTVL
jgi:hypothetical protein